MFVYILLFLMLFTLLGNVYSQEVQPVYLIFIWHFHQPWYYGENDSYLILPWVRMHSVGNYFKMAYILSKYPDIKATFTFSGSLLVQLESYLEGSRDLRQILSMKVAYGENLTPQDIYNIVSIPGGFFDINWGRIVDQVPRYRELRDKAQNILQSTIYMPEEDRINFIARSFTEQDIIDLVALFNLFWIDPQVLRDLYPDLYTLRENAINNASIHFTRDQIKEILDAQLDIMKRIIPLYRDLLEKGQIEIIPVPYSHPLAPIIVDLGWSEDLNIHTIRSIELFKEIFNYTPSGVWPAEQAVNEKVIDIFSRYFTWSVSDQLVLGKSGVDVGDVRNITSLWSLNFGNKTFYMFFRVTDLSNMISFTYSSWSPDQAVEDLVNRIRALGSVSGPGSVVVIALDGENPWENYAEFGDLFLNKLYSSLEDLQRRNIIRTITPSEYISLFKDRAREIPIGIRSYLNLSGVDISDTPISYTEDAYQNLPRTDVRARLAEGSWAGGELTMWIGQRQENVAWMYLAKAREDLFRILNVSDLSQALAINKKAVEYLLRAEASDWFWWYGGDAGGFFPVNQLYKLYLRKIYESLEVQVPQYLLTVYNPDATPLGTLNREPPKPISQSITIDGFIRESDWSNSLNISIGSIFNYALIALSPTEIYIALKPSRSDVLRDPSISISIYTTTPWKSVSPYHLGYNPLAPGDIDLGMGLFNDLRITPYNSSASVYTADGSGRWIYMYPVQSIAIGDVIEISLPWILLGLREGDTAYVTIAVYREGKMIEDSSRDNLVYMIQVPRPVLVAGASVLVDLRDPENDDKGPGTYEYPKADVFKPGVFDLTRFRVLGTGDKIIFEIYFRDLGGNPWGGPNGFSLQYIHIYIRTTEDLPSRNDTFGLNVVLDPNSSWHVAILIAPGWGSDPVPKGEKSAIYYYNDTVIVQDSRFRVYADTSRNAIIAEIDRSLLPDTENIPRWVFTVAVASYDGYGPNRIRPIGVSADTWTIGAGARYARAILCGVAPLIMDLLAPTAEDQYAMLNSFVVPNQTCEGSRKAVIHGVNYTYLEELEIKGRTVTQTITYTQYTTYTITIMPPPRTTTEIHTEIKTIPQEIPQIPGVISMIGALIAGVLIGLLIMYSILHFTRRRS
ncbi:MAG: glucodextranase DOMON-like domain-containing protein [Sulfolobales archaeon]